MKTDATTTVRFAAVLPDGRRSSSWRIWTGGRWRDEVYLGARSSVGQVKVSLHRSGYCQHGFVERVRAQLPLGERDALDRGQQPLGQPGVLEPAYLVYLAGSEFLAQQPTLPSATTLLPCTEPNRQIVVGVFFVRPPLPDPEDTLGPLQYLVRLPDSRGSAVDVLWAEDVAEVGRLDQIRDILDKPTGVRTLPMPISKELDYAYGFGENPTGPVTGLRWCAEIAVLAQSNAKP